MSNIDCDPSDLSREAEYLSKVKWEVDVLSLPIEGRRKILKQELIADYLLKVGKADIDGVESTCDLVEDDGNYVEMDGVFYKTKVTLVRAYSKSTYREVCTLFPDSLLP